jgi:hypothetical protein
MATKKKASKRSTKAKKTLRKKATPKKSGKRPKKLAKKKPAPKRAAKTAPKKSAKKTATAPPKKSVKQEVSAKKQPPKRNAPLPPVTFSRTDDRSDSAGQSGDLQGLSRIEGADSESVDELLEEGNAFEAEVVAGIERAGDADEKEVRTHEVPEDDVPEEYLDKD